MNRESFFLDKPLREAEKLAWAIKELRPTEQDAARLGVNSESLAQRMSDHHKVLVKLGDTLGLLHDSRGKGAPRAKACESRAKSGTMNTKNAR